MEQDNKLDNLPTGKYELLLTRLDENRDGALQKFFDLRLKIIKFLSNDRFGSDYELIADETLDEVDDYLVKGNEVKNIDALALTIARRKWIAFYQKQKKQTPLENSEAENKRAKDFVNSLENQEIKSKRLECLKQCQDKNCSKEEQEQLERYYTKNEGNKELAKEMGVTDGNLRVIMLRLRAKIKDCLIECLGIPKSL